MDTKKNWTVDDAKELYGIERWSQGYFDIAENGNIQITPEGSEGPKVDLPKLLSDLKERGIRFPMQIRFSDIVKSRVELLSECFNTAIKEYKYQGSYQGVYPIKVNQQKHLVQEIVKFGAKYNLGLECGSKPELLITIAYMNNPNAFIICNGFKDTEYIETALLSQKLGHKVFIVIDRFEEIQMIIDASKKLSIRPHIGFRCKLNAKGAGKWVESSGVKSKFGLSPSEIVRGVSMLKDSEMLDSLQLLHFHIGSQIPSIQAIKSSIREGARYYTELKKLAPNLSFIDVGGGLGVDYDGTRLSDSSVNYSEQEYTNDVVSAIQNVCDETGVDHPNIVSESGRALVAHSSALFFDVMGKNTIAPKIDIEGKENSDSPVVKDLYYILEFVCEENVNEFYNDLVEKRRDTLQLFKYGVLDLVQRAKAEDLYWAIAKKMTHITRGIEEFENIFYKLEAQLCDTYFCNFSIFQSLPDSWALHQIFPVMPVHRLNERPTNRAVLVDLTCDSDGKIDTFIDTETGNTQDYLEVHEFDDSEDYWLGAFIAGAYQEILGDLHNLFGDTDTVHVSIHKDGYSIDHVVAGDSVTEVLSYVEYSRPELVERVRKAAERGILNQTLSRQEARALMRHYEDGLSGYTYFEGKEDF